MSKQWRAVAVMSVDGVVSPPDGSPPNRASQGGWTSEEDKHVLNDELSRADVVVMGRKTYEQSGRFMVLDKHHVAVVGSSTAAMFRRGFSEMWSSAKTIVQYTHARRFYDYLTDECGDPRVLICGGPATYRLFRRMIDTWTIVLEPMLLGGNHSLLENRNESMHAQELTLWGHEVLNNRGTLRLTYRRTGSPEKL